MPAITGFIGRGGYVEKTAILQQMVKSVVHELFYTSGTYSNEELGIWIGWTNLKGSFSDCMPVWNEKRDICLIFSGEDYRDADEIAQIRRRGHVFREGYAGYLVHFYEELGDGFFEKLNGRFSGAIIDLRQKRTVLFNDRYGLNRIYYHEKDGMFFFSSEAKSLLSVLPELKQIDLDALAETFSFGCVLQNRTLYQGISLIPGGSVWTFRPGSLAHKSSYFLPKQLECTEPLTSSEYFSKLKEAWIRILPRYLRSPERTALSMTGGKDCRMILAWAQSPPGSLPCYTFGGMYRDCYDVKIGRRVARISGQTHQVIKVGKEFIREFPHYAQRTVYLTDGNMDVTGSPGLYVNSRARDVAPVRLTGNYGQEILRSYIAFKPVRTPSSILDSDFARMTDNASRLYRDQAQGNQLSFVAFKQVPWHHYSRLASELSQLTLRSPYLDNEILALAFQAPRELDDRDDIQLRLTAEGNPELAKIETDRGLLYKPVPLYSWMKNQLQEFSAKAEYAYDYGMPDALTKFDNMFRALHVERLFLGRHKYYHFRIWFRDELSDYVREILLDPRTLKRPFVRGQKVEEAVKAHLDGTANHTTEISRLLTAELTYRQLIETRA
jgi:asparagine synthase (glutamine-hydrolysing)